MGDTLNALQMMQGPRASAGTLPPSVVANPLAALQAGTTAASNVMDLRSKQADQAWGQALQAATDPQTGVVDFNKAQALAAANPVAAMGMARNLATASNIKSQQVQQVSGIYDLAGRASASVLNDPSDANLDNIRGSLVAAGAPPNMVAEVDRIKSLPVEQRGAEAYKHLNAALDGQAQLARGGYPAPQNVTAGNVQVPTATTPPTPYGPGGTRVLPGGVSLGLPPEIANQPYTYTDKDNVVQHTTVGEYLKTLGPGAPPSGQQVGTPPPSGTIPPNPNVPPGTPPGRIVPPPALANPNKPPPTTTTPPPTTTAAPPPTAPVPGGGLSIQGPAAGQTPAAEDTARQSAQMGTALTARADQVPTNKANYANMLSDLGRIGSMPPGGEKEVAINTFLQKATGFGLTMTADQVAAANSFAKLANIAVGQQLQAIGGTDARQALFMGSNPNLDLSRLGNQQIIHMLQGNEDAIQAKSRAWQGWLKSGHGTDTYGQFQDDFNHHFDPRVFQQQYMGAPEIAALRKSMSGPGETQKFLDDVIYARRQGWIQ